MLVGDAAGLAYPQSGEGIRPAIESGLLAATTIIEAAGRYSSDRLASYEQRLRARLNGSAIARGASRVIPPALSAWLGVRLMAAPAFVRHVVLDRWFLHAHQEPLASGHEWTVSAPCASG